MQLVKCTQGLRIHVGMDEMYEIVNQAKYRFFRVDEMYKLVMDEMYEIVWIWIFWNWLKFEYEYSRICVVSVVRAKTLCYWWSHVDVVVLVVWVVFVWFVVCNVWLIKLGYTTNVAVAVRISLILGCLRCAWYTWNFLWHKS